LATRYERSEEIAAQVIDGYLGEQLDKVYRALQRVQIGDERNASWSSSCCRSCR
jgi:hypothetical protein